MFLVAATNEDSERGTCRRVPSSIVACLLAFLVYCAGDRYIQAILPTSYQFKQALLAGPGVADAVVLGSSHSFYGIVASRLYKNSVNLANISQSVFIDEQLLSKYFETHRPPKLVIEPISYASLRCKLTESTEEWRDCWYYHYMHVSERSIHERLADKRYWGLPSLLGVRKLWQIANGDLSEFPTASLDFSGSPDKDSPTAAISDETGRQRVQFHDQFNLNPGLARKSLEHMAQMCRDHGTKLVFVTLPVYRTYSRFMNKQRFRSDVQEVKTVPNTYYIDFLEDPEFTVLDFMDNDHLNHRGACKCTNLLKERCAELLAIKPDFERKPCCSP
jgi:hypothetical protein